MSFKFTHSDWFAWVFITSNNIYFYSDENEFHIFSWIKHVACHFWSTTVHMIIHAHNKMNKNEVPILKSLLVKLASNIFAPLNTGKFLTLKYFFFLLFSGIYQCELLFLVYLINIQFEWEREVDIITCLSKFALKIRNQMYVYVPVVI